MHLNYSNGQTRKTCCLCLTAYAAKLISTANDSRLVIEENPETRTYVYKIVDRKTGEVIRQYPREEILRLIDAPDYQPGQVVKAQT